MLASSKQAFQSQREVESNDFVEGAEMLLGLKFATWIEQTSSAEPVVEPASSRASSGTPNVHSSVTRKCREWSRSKRTADYQSLSSDEDLSDDEEYRPAKIRVIHTGTSGSPIVLPRRSYTWRGASRKQVTQQPEGAADSTAAFEQCGADSAARMISTVSGVTEAAATRHSESTEPGTDAAGPNASAWQPEQSPQAAAVGCSNDTKEGDKEWAALTTWLRMNLHNPRTSKKVVLFVGQRGVDGQWSFDLNPLLTWEDLSLDTKLRLRDLLQETQAAFQRKYPNRPSSDWMKKSQKYKAPGSSQTFQVPLEHLVMSLHHMYQRIVCNASVDAVPSSSGSMDSSRTAQVALMPGQPASPTVSHNS